MKLSAFKNVIKDRFTILHASLVYTWAVESAYPWTNIGRIIGSLLYTLSTLIYINILYQKVTLIAGYNQPAMLVFFMVGQVALFTAVSFSTDNIQDLVVMVNTGNLDLVLTKPLPSLFYVSIKNISLFQIIVEELIPIPIMIHSINWSNLSITPISFLGSTFVFICGILAMHVFQFIFALPVFWIGESSNLVDLTWGFEYNAGRVIPYEGFSAPFKIIFTTLIPSLITTALSTSVMLGKSPVFPTVIYSLVIATIALLIKNYLWKIALRSYTSASS